MVVLSFDLPSDGGGGLPYVGPLGRRNGAPKGSWTFRKLGEFQVSVRQTLSWSGQKARCQPR